MLQSFNFSLKQNIKVSIKKEKLASFKDIILIISR